MSDKADNLPWISCDIPPNSDRKVYLTVCQPDNVDRRVIHADSRFMQGRWYHWSGTLIQGVPVSWLDLPKVLPDRTTLANVELRNKELLAATVQVCRRIHTD